MDAIPIRQDAAEPARPGERALSLVEAVVPEAKAESPWYKDPPRLVGVLGFLLAVATIGERAFVRSSELTSERLQELRDATIALADIQSDYLGAVAANPQNLYQLGVAKNTKRQMLLQTADALLDYRSVNSQASAQIFGALAAEAMSDGRYSRADTYFRAALVAPGGDPVKPFILRSLGILYRVPNTPLSDPSKARDYFAQALALFEEHPDDSGHLSWAETVLTEGNLEAIYGNVERAKQLGVQAQLRIEKVKSRTPARVQLERWGAALANGEPFGQPPPSVSVQAITPSSADVSNVPAATAQNGMATPALDGGSSATGISFEIWSTVPGQMSGAEMTVQVDGKDVGALSNLGENRRLELKGISPGPHKLTLLIAKVYFIDPVKGPSLTGGPFQCEALFEAKSNSAPLRINVATGFNGLVCGAQ